MIMDKQLMFSEGQAITATAASTNIIDLGVARNIGAGSPLTLVFLVTEAFTDSGSDSTVTPALETDDNAAFSSATVIRTFDVFAALTAINTMRLYRLEPFTATGAFERYIRINYTVANGNLSTGKFTTFILKEGQDWRPYAANYSVF